MVSSKRKLEYGKLYRATHKEQIKESSRLYHIKNRDKILQTSKIYREKNIDKLREKSRINSRKYRELHRDKINAWHKIYKQNNRLKFKIYQHNRINKAGGELRISVVQKVYEENIKKFGTLTCYLCKQPILFGKDQVEHKTPISRGGSNNYENLEIACRICNEKKHTKTFEEYVLERKI